MFTSYMCVLLLELHFYCISIAIFIPEKTCLMDVFRLYFSPGIIVAGPPGTGKSSCISGLVETLSECSLMKHKNTGSQMHTHRLQRINPLAVSDPALMFGKVNSSSDFEDGIFTAYFRKANKEHSVHKMTTWICLDAPLHQGWAEFLSSALDKGEVMTSQMYCTQKKRVWQLFLNTQSRCLSIK